MSELRATNGQVKIPHDVPNLLGAPEALVTAVHQLGVSAGYARVRLDRGLHRPSGAWYEVGYAGGEVRIRYSHLGTTDYRVNRADVVVLQQIASVMWNNRNEAEGMLP